MKLDRHRQNHHQECWSCSDATIIDAPPSTKNEAKARDPEMKSGKKNAREWHFGMKAHVGTDPNGLVHSLVTTHAGASEFKQLPKLLHGKEKVLYGDQAYWSEMHRVAAKQHGVRYRGQSPSEPREEAECVPEETESAALGDPCARRARFSCGQESVGI
jgi:hypothetical protein